MTYLTALVRLDHWVAAWAALDQHASTRKATGGSRSRGQIMAAELVDRLIGTTTASTTAAGTDPETAAVAAAAATVRDDAGDVIATDNPLSLTAGLMGLPIGVGLDIQLVMTDRALFDGDDEPAIITGHGPIPAALARHLIRCTDTATRVFLRRLYTDPHTGDLVGADTRRRLFPPAARQFLVTRDQVCRQSWRGSPIRHADHITPYARTAITRLDDAQGLCEHCSQLKETPGWTHHANPDRSVTVTTPTGHVYRNTPPRPPGSTPWPAAPPTRTERVLHHRLRRLRTIGPSTWAVPDPQGTQLEYEPAAG